MIPDDQYKTLGLCLLTGIAPDYEYNAVEYDGAAECVAIVMDEMEDEGKLIDLVTVSQELERRKEVMELAPFCEMTLPWPSFLVYCITLASYESAST